MFKIIDVNKLDGATKSLMEMTKRGVTSKLYKIADTFLDIMQKEAPVNTGQFLASFHVGDSTTGAAAEPGPKARSGGNKYDAAIEAANRQRAAEIMHSNYDREAFKTDPYRKFFITNNAPHAAHLEYGGSKDFTSGAHRGIIASALNRALAAAKVQKK